MRFLNNIFIALSAVVLLASCGSKADVVIESDYLVVASDTVMADEAWSAVVQTLAKKHKYTS